MIDRPAEDDVVPRQPQRSGVTALARARRVEPHGADGPSGNDPGPPPPVIDLGVVGSGPGGPDGPDGPDDGGEATGWRRHLTKRRAILGGAVAAVVGAATFKGLSGSGGDLAVPAPPPRRKKTISAKEAGGFENRDQSFAASIGEAAPAAPAPAPTPTNVYPTASAAAAAATVTVPTILATDDPVLHMLRRMTFGLTPGLVEEAHAQGIDAWLAAQLDPDSIPDGEGDAAWGIFPKASMSTQQVQASQDRFAWDAMFEVGQATLARQIWSKRQLHETMADFWANHLNVSTPGNGGWDVSSSWHRDVIRAHALGSFTDMLLAANRHPAMLRYLSNDESNKDSVNENLGRELLELHTVGVASGYTEADVRNSAYILTGRSVGGEMDERGPWGEFAYDPGIHWTGAVTVLGFTHANDSAEGGLDVGDAYLRYLAGHPATSQQIARKLATRFVSDSPPQELVDRMATAYVDGGTQIRPVLDIMFRSVEFWSAVGQKTRRPLENIVASARAVGIAPGGNTRKPIEWMYWTTGDAGQKPLAWPAPNGYPDVQAAWRSANGLPAGVERPPRPGLRLAGRCDLREARPVRRRPARRHRRRVRRQPVPAVLLPDVPAASPRRPARLPGRDRRHADRPGRHPAPGRAPGARSSSTPRTSRCDEVLRRAFHARRPRGDAAAGGRVAPPRVPRPRPPRAQPHRGRPAGDRRPGDGRA